MQTPAAEPGTRKVNRTASRFTKGRILVMDDDEYVRGVIRSMLQGYGYRVCIAKDGNEAIRKFEAAKKLRRPFDALILDLVVARGMTGHEALEQLRIMEPGIKAVLLTGDINHHALVRYSECGFKAVLLKPFTRTELIQSIEWAITD